MPDDEVTPMPADAAISKGRMQVGVSGCQGRALTFGGVEILRGFAVPVRDEDWGTMAVEIQSEARDADRLSCRFAHRGGQFDGTLRVTLPDERHFEAELELTFRRNAHINRAGFVLLHPTPAVVGEPLTIRHPDGTTEASVFPQLIAPSQPARDIRGLDHDLAGLRLSIDFEGDVFEMEDQRNWSDASFKTYCRPLSDPRPFAVAAGEVIRQRVSLSVDGEPEGLRRAARVHGKARLPCVELAYEAGLSRLEALDAFPGIPVLARIDADTTTSELQVLAHRNTVAIECVVDAVEQIPQIAERIRTSGLTPVRIAGLPGAYLKSHQPEGPWPAGPDPAAVAAGLRAAFPGVPVGGGSLTYFPEFNRCPPPSGVDFATFGNSATVHVADDLSICQTLDALPDIFATAVAKCLGRPLRLGLFSIALRSNPYGADVVANPGGAPCAMARKDARQDTGFAAAYAGAVLALAARAQVASIALAMPDGELGAVHRPIGEFIRRIAPFADVEAEVATDSQIFEVRLGRAEYCANLSDAPHTTARGEIVPPRDLRIFDGAA